MLLHTLEGHSRCTNSIEFSPDGKLLASAPDDTTVRLWDTAVGKVCKTLHGYFAKVSVVHSHRTGGLWHLDPRIRSSYCGIHLREG